MCHLTIQLSQKRTYWNKCATPDLVISNVNVLALMCHIAIQLCRMQSQRHKYTPVIQIFSDATVSTLTCPVSATMYDAIMVTQVHQPP